MSHQPSRTISMKYAPGVLGRARTCKIFRQDYGVLENGVFIRDRYVIFNHSTPVIQHLQVWDVIPGDIHIIAPVTRSLRKYRTVRYQDSYCTIENSDTRKVIRKYQTSGDDREDTIEVSVYYPVSLARSTCSVF